MSREKELAKNTVILAFGKICTQSISFLMLPLYTAVLDTKDYGTFDLLVTYATLLLPLVNWQFDQGLFRFLLEKRGNHRAQSQLFSTILISGTIQSGAYAGIFFLIRPLLSIANGEFLLAYVILHVYTAILLQFVRGLGDNTKYAVAGFISASSTVFFNVITLTVFKWGLKGLMTATLLSQVFTIIYLAVSVRCWKYFSVKRAKYSLFRSVLSYSLPLIPNNLAWWVVNASDRTVISHFIGLAANGIFTVSSKFPSVFISFYNIVNLSWTESVSLHFNDEDRDVFLTDMVTMFFKIFASACFGVVAVMPFIFPVMVNAKYREGYNQVLILMYAMLFRVLVGLYSCVYIAAKQSKKVAYTSAAAAVINLTADLLFINRIGLYAASLSSLIAFLVMFIIRYVEINRTVHMRIKRAAALSSIAMGVLLTFAFYSGSTTVQVMALAVTAAYGVWANADLLRTVLNMARKGAKG